MTTKTTAKTTAPTAPPLPDQIPQHFLLSTGFMDLVAIGARSLYRDMRALALPLPAAVVDAVRPLDHAAHWLTQPPQDLRAAREAWRQSLHRAAHDLDAEPSAEGVIASIVRERAAAAIHEDLRLVATELHHETIRQIRRSLDEALLTLTGEHDRLAARIRELGASIPSTTRSGDMALAAGVGPEWHELNQASQRFLKVREVRAKAARWDHVRDAEEFAGWRTPDNIPADGRWPESPALHGLMIVNDHVRAEPWSPSRSQIADRIEEVKAERAAKRTKPRGPVNAAVWAGSGLR